MKQLLLFLTWCIASTAFAQKEVYNAIVAADGSGDYTTVQAAIDAVPDDNLSQYLIYIKARSEILNHSTSPSKTSPSPLVERSMSRSNISL